MARLGHADLAIALRVCALLSVFIIGSWTVTILPLHARTWRLSLTPSYPADSYGIGRHGKYRDQAFALDRWGNRWVVCNLQAPDHAARHPRN